MPTKTLTTALSLALAAGVSFAAKPAAEHPSPSPREASGDAEPDVRDLVGLAKVSLRDAIRAALDARSGRAVEAELEGERRDGSLSAHYSVTVLTAEHVVVEVEIDAMTGAVLGVEEDEDEQEDSAAYVRVLRHAERSLAELVEAAEAFVKGTPVAAELEFEQRTPLCEVDFVHTRYVIEVELEARAGHLLEIELEEEEEEEEEGESAGDEENGEDEPQEQGDGMHDVPAPMDHGAEAAEAETEQEVTEQVVTEQEVGEQVVAEPAPTETPPVKRRR